MCPETVKVGAILSVILRVILVVDSVGLEVFYIDFTDAARNEQLDFIRHKVA